MTGVTVAFDDLATHPRTTALYASAFAPIHVRAHLTVPLHRDGLWVATFWAAHHEAHPWTPEEIQLMRALAERVWSVVERKRAEEALKDADRRKDQFLAVLAHELRNPLAPVRNAAEYLKSRDLPDADTQRSVRMVERQVAHMARLLDDLLDVSRISRGVLDLRLEPLDFADVAQSAIDAVGDELAGRGHALAVHLPREPLPLRADRDRLIQVFSNLLSNAAKYTPASGRIEFRAEREGDVLRVTVADNGIGIPREKLSDIFELFVQVDRSLERQGGLGIGLTLARDLVELHGGKLEARSEGTGRGSTFVTTLPVAPAPAGAEQAREAVPGAPPRRVLVVDDNQDAAESLQLLLERDGHDVRIAFDGLTALAMGAELGPDVAFLDIGMPDMTGYELATRIRGEAWGAGVRLVALTGWGQDTDRQQAKDAGFDDHLVKPAAPDALARMLWRRDGVPAGTPAPRA
jgi:signal transduction histidine kinase/ActR/RegA family two-component response regulator